MKTLETFVLGQYSPKSAPGYLYIIKRYLGYTGEKALTAGYTDVLNYIGHLRTLELHPKSLINILFCIKIYYRWLVATNQRKDHPCQHLYLQDQVNKRIQVESLYTPEALDELLKKHKSKRPLMQKRDEIIITLLTNQALTVQEIAAINLEDINLNEATIKAKGGYKQRPRTLALQASQILLIHHYINQDRPELLKKNKRLTLDDEAAFLLGNTGNRILAPYINRLINTGRKKYNALKPMKIRQSVIAHLLKQKNDLRIVQVFAGHKRSGSTEEYKQTALEELRTLIERLHPLESIQRNTATQ